MFDEPAGILTRDLRRVRTQPYSKVYIVDMHIIRTDKHYGYPA